MSGSFQSTDGTFSDRAFPIKQQGQSHGGVEIPQKFHQIHEDIAERFQAWEVRSAAELQRYMYR